MEKKLVRRQKWRWLHLLVLVLGITWVQASPAEADPIAPNGLLNITNQAMVKFSPPTLVDLDGDGDQEILIGSIDGKVTAIDYDQGSSSLTVLWTFNTSPTMGGPTIIRGAISAADLDGNGSIEIVVPVGDIFETLTVGGLVVLNSDGDLLWSYKTFDHHGIQPSPDGLSDGVVSSPALGDLDNDGDLEIVFGGFDFRVHVLHHDGEVAAGWPKFLRDTIWSSPALADLDNDGDLEIIIGIDVHEEAAFNTQNGGGLYVFNFDGTSVPNWPQFIGEALYSSPAVGDLDGDGTLEIVHGTSDFFKNATAGHKIYTWSANGTLKWTGQTNGYTFASPALADLDGNGTLEVIANSKNDMKTFVWNHDGSTLWAREPLNHQGKPIELSNAPIAADYDNDGNPDVLSNVFWDAVVLDGPSGNQLTSSRYPGDPRPGHLSNFTASDNSPAIGDIDGDGLLELVIANANEFSANKHAQVVYWNLPTPATADATPWPMWGQSPAHTNLLQLDHSFESQVVSHSLPAVALPGGSAQVSITFKNVGTQTWTPNTVRLASVNNVGPSQVALPKNVAPGEEVTIQFDWQPSSQLGYQEVGWRLAESRSGRAFGPRIGDRIKIGNQPALQVLTKEGIFAGGLSTTPLPNPPGLSNWPAAQTWKLIDDKRGYRLLDEFGAVWTGGSAMPLYAPQGRTNVWDMVLGADGISFWILAGDGFIYGCNTDHCDHRFSPAPPTNITARSLALTGDGKGVYVVDGFGTLYTGGNAPALPQIAGFPLGEDLIVRMKVTKSGQGYYLLDKYGRVYAGGNAPALALKYEPRIGVNWAIDFELTDDEQGFYMLSRDGIIHAGGNADPLEVNVPPIRNSDFARDLELIDSRRNNAPNLSVPPDFGSQLVEQGSQNDVTFKQQIANSGDTPLNWDMSADWAASRSLPAVDITPSSGTLQPGTSQTVTIHIPDIGDQPTGEYTLDLTVRASANGVEVTQRSTISIEVVDELFNIYLPATVR